MTSRGNSPPNNEAKLLKARWPQNGAMAHAARSCKLLRERARRAAIRQASTLGSSIAETLGFAGTSEAFFDRLRVSEEG
jgi:hypothetical protein